MRKIIVLFFALLLTFSFVSCSKKSETDDTYDEKNSNAESLEEKYSKPSEEAKKDDTAKYGLSYELSTTIEGNVIQGSGITFDDETKEFPVVVFWLLINETDVRAACFYDAEIEAYNVCYYCTDLHWGVPGTGNFYTMVSDDEISYMYQNFVAVHDVDMERLMNLLNNGDYSAIEMVK